MKSNNSIILCENDKIVNDPKEVTEIFNIKIDKTHPSINKIETNRTNKDKLFFKPINGDFVTKQINKLNIKQATGYDGISPKIIKFAQPVITNLIKVLINKSIDQSVFPEKLKAAQVSPLFKKNNSLDKSNYRPISVLPTISKFYERAIFDQLMEFLNNHFNPLLSAFRSGFGCQTALLRIIEDWKKALDDNKFIAAILMDQSNLLILTLEAYANMVSQKIL
jgi:hypothetical protein